MGPLGREVEMNLALMRQGKDPREIAEAQGESQPMPGRVEHKGSGVVFPLVPGLLQGTSLADDQLTGTIQHESR